MLLLPLAITSFNYFIRKMGNEWKSLHRLVYAAGMTVIIHYAWAKKGSLFTLSGDILQPLLWGVLVVILLSCACQLAEVDQRAKTKHLGAHASIETSENQNEP